MQDAIIGENDRKSRYLIVGGDDRQVELAKILKKNNFEISTLGMENASLIDIKNYTDIGSAVKDSDVFIGPIPFSKEKNIINSKYAGRPLEMDKLFELLDDSKLFLAGAMNKNSRETADKYNVKYIDYYWDESYQVLNAIPTAEGALAIMVNETDITIHGSNVLVLGYGRIGKVLSEYLKALGANVFVGARKDHDLTWIKARGMVAVPIEEINLNIYKMSVIVNTIPYLILDKERLNLVDDDATLIDLASMPGGIDFSYAEEKGLKAIHALSLPGKVASKTAAIYIYDTISKLLKG